MRNSDRETLKAIYEEIQNAEKIDEEIEGSLKMQSMAWSRWHICLKRKRLLTDVTEIIFTY